MALCGSQESVDWMQRGKTSLCPAATPGNEAAGSSRPAEAEEEEGETAGVEGLAHMDTRWVLCPPCRAGDGCPRRPWTALGSGLTLDSVLILPCLSYLRSGFVSLCWGGGTLRVPARLSQWEARI